jgi:3-oxoacyl-[acyl-carrier protein] reductase
MITGAQSGIGRACAERFHAEGAHLVLVDLHFDEQIGELAPGATLLTADVAQENGASAIAAAMEQMGVEVLINNAGITADATLLKMQRSQWDQVIAVNLTAVFCLSQLAARHFVAGGIAGVILNAASVVAHYGNFGQANYSAAKGGLIAMTRTLAKELGRHGIRVNAVAPGFISTPMVEKIPAKILDQMRTKPPLARLGTPAEVAAAYAFLASDDASYITGATLDVDGGMVLG